MQAQTLEYLKAYNQTRVIITLDENSIDKISDIVSYLGYEAVSFPDFRASSYDDLRSYTTELSSILIALRKFYSNPKSILISPYNTLLHALPAKEYLLQTLTLSFGDTLDTENLKSNLYRWGYEFVDIVECKGEVSFRGDIFDIYPIDATYPYRISLFDTEIEEIREFDEVSQKTITKDLEDVNIPPALFGLSQSEYENLNSKIENFDTNLIQKDVHSLGFWFLKNSIHLTDKYQSVFVQSLEKEFDEAKAFDKDCSILKNISVMSGAKVYQDVLSTEPKNLLKIHSNKKIKILAHNKELLKANDLEHYLEYFEESNLKVNILSNKEIIISLNKKTKTKNERKKPTILLDDLKVNDYIVHTDYGVGKFIGLNKHTVLGTTKDYLEVMYQNDDKVLVPIENISLIDRYISDSGVLASMDKLGRGTFAKLKAKAKVKLLEIADEIIKTAARRELIKIPKVNISKHQISEFRDNIGFDYTLDQVKCCEEIFEDLQKPLIMDRLLSADVGFGKTEIALNVAFSVLKEGYQVALAAPTTLLSNQLYLTFKKRFEKYHDIKIAQVNSKISAKEKATIKESLKNGDINLVIGTHSIFNLEFKNLLLLIIDEEHKFGVKQKETLKQLKSNIHVLSMSATPIPRSLNLALSQVKQYSMISTPPKNRKDIRTFVKNHDKNVIKEAISRELKRNGQVFYLHNRIATIENKQKELQSLLPNLRIVTLHSKISPVKLENEMLKFQNKEYDLLLCTSIIESGLHIPNANTLIVENANTFGIADLHQLRGRVGRSDTQGYCYLLIKDEEEITENASKRLLSLQNNSYLGSGAALAMHDLEIRGGGNIVGKDQSGHIKNIGYALYLRMLEDAINLLLNKESTNSNNVDLNLSVSSYINESYIPQDRLRLEIYRRLGNCKSIHEVYEIEQELIDRFGNLDSDTSAFLSLIIIKILAAKHNIVQVSNYKKSITLIYKNEKKTYIEARSNDEDDILQDLLIYLKELKLKE
ncbi:MAG: Transcription-repair coupling factor [uncultured Campylobacterales bacterium]|uniref:Transcription-repair-coupling factor n=1 Tax=uncultured Campylobacterales bacterium TaxID=352960 RepID=A0A6S6TDC7_9BACT|nr:MAG: Transcription-repair coupling factor [uncultured Campylobacterales bacterium]